MAYCRFVRNAGLYRQDPSFHTPIKRFKALQRPLDESVVKQLQRRWPHFVVDLKRPCEEIGSL